MALLTFLSEMSDATDSNSLTDQTIHRCEGGVVADADPDRSVREKCGDPLKIADKQGYDPIWIYHEPQANFM